MNWNKRNGTTGKVKPSARFLVEEKFTFQRTISAAVSCHDIPDLLVLNIDQTPLAYVSPGKYTFSSKGVKSVPIKGVDDKQQIIAIFAVRSTGSFLPIQLVYTGKTRRCLPRYDFPASFSVSFTKTHRLSTEKSKEFFERIIFSCLKKSEKGKTISGRTTFTCYYGHIQDNGILKKIYSENRCEIAP